METVYEIAKSIFISLLTAIITVKLSLRRFQTEKWWEKKTEAYENIIEVLHHLKDYCEKELNARYQFASMPFEEEKELRQQYRTAIKELTKAIDVGAFIISDEAVKILEAYKNRPELSYDENDIMEIIERDLKDVKECLSKFKIAAKKDIGIR